MAEENKKESEKKEVNKKEPEKKVEPDKKAQNKKVEPDKKASKKDLPDLVKDRATTDNFSDTFLLTGNIAFDLAISNGKGLPVGDFIMISSPRGCGKTTLCFDLISRLLKKHKENNIPFKVMHIDIEGSSTLAESFGLKDYLDNELVYHPGQVTFAKLENLYNSIIGGQHEVTKDIKVIIIDSIAGVTTQGMVDKDVEKAHFGLVAKAASEFFKKFTPLCKEHGITTIMINHEKVQQGVTNFQGGAVKTEAGGDAAAYMSTCLLRLSKRQGGNDADLKKVNRKTILGVAKTSDKFVVVIKSPDKNRYCRIGEVEMYVQAGKCIINYNILKKILENVGLLKKSGLGFVLDDEIALPEVSGVKLDKKELKGYLDKYEKGIMEYLISNNLFKYYLDEEEDDDDDFDD